MEQGGFSIWTQVSFKTLNNLSRHFDGAFIRHINDGVSEIGEGGASSIKLQVFVLEVMFAWFSMRIGDSLLRLIRDTTSGRLWRNPGFGGRRRTGRVSVCSAKVGMWRCGELVSRLRAEKPLK